MCVINKKRERIDTNERERAPSSFKKRACVSRHTQRETLKKPLFSLTSLPQNDLRLAFEHFFHTLNASLSFRVLKVERREGRFFRVQNLIRCGIFLSLFRDTETFSSSSSSIGISHKYRRALKPLLLETTTTKNEYYIDDGFRASCITEHRNDDEKQPSRRKKNAFQK